MYQDLLNTFSLVGHSYLRAICPQCSHTCIHDCQCGDPSGRGYRRSFSNLIDGTLTTTFRSGHWLLKTALPSNNSPAVTSTSRMKRTSKNYPLGSTLNLSLFEKWYPCVIYFLIAWNDIFTVLCLLYVLRNRYRSYLGGPICVRRHNLRAHALEDLQYETSWTSVGTVQRRDIPLITRRWALQKAPALKVYSFQRALGAIYFAWGFRSHRKLYIGCITNIYTQGNGFREFGQHFDVLCQSLSAIRKPVSLLILDSWLEYVSQLSCSPSHFLFWYTRSLFSKAAYRALLAGEYSPHRFSIPRSTLLSKYISDDDVPTHAESPRNGRERHSGRYSYEYGFYHWDLDDGLGGDWRRTSSDRRI